MKNFRFHKIQSKQPHRGCGNSNCLDSIETRGDYILAVYSRLRFWLHFSWPLQSQNANHDLFD